MVPNKAVPNKTVPNKTVQTKGSAYRLSHQRLPFVSPFVICWLAACKWCQKALVLQYASFKTAPLAVLVEAAWSTHQSVMHIDVHTRTSRHVTHLEVIIHYHSSPCVLLLHGSNGLLQRQRAPDVHAGGDAHHSLHCKHTKTRFRVRKLCAQRAPCVHAGGAAQHTLHCRHAP